MSGRFRYRNHAVATPDRASQSTGVCTEWVTQREAAVPEIPAQLRQHVVYRHHDDCVPEVAAEQDRLNA